ncbi:hypothetical protein ACJZ2D_014626 [Fusarium nematophilum]
MTAPSSSLPKLDIAVEFSGGLEMLFSNKRHHPLAIPAVDQDGKPASIAYLIDHLCQNVMEDSRKELFVLDNHLYVLGRHLPHLLHRPLCTSVAFANLPCPPLHPLPLSMLQVPVIVLVKDTTSFASIIFFDSSAADVCGDSRPGILVLINDADWELEGEEAYEIQSGDSILFVSTLHGG